jgi:hypothetical protein
MNTKIGQNECQRKNKAIQRNESTLTYVKSPDEIWSNSRGRLYIVR